MMKKWTLLVLALFVSTFIGCSPEQAEETSETEDSSNTITSEEGDYLQAATGNEEEIKIKISETEQASTLPSEDTEYVEMMGIESVSEDWNEEGIVGIIPDEELIAYEMAEAKELGWRVISGYDLETPTEENKAELLKYFGDLNKCNIVDELGRYVSYYEPDCDDVYLWEEIGVVQGCDIKQPSLYGDLDCGEKGTHRVIATYVGDNLYYSGWIIECEYFDHGDPLRKNETN